ncbi:MAG: sulfotransferase domain-containing protein [Proteobacteria bacterium]|nr:sulfotransferase domain-containing protein [Pseudomonadota bacterium]
MENKIHLDFLALGTQKAGTTSLHDWLAQHDDIRLPSIKETHFFSHEDRFQYGMDWYLKQFPSKPAAFTITGEIDPEYLFIEGAAEKIKNLTDVNKFIVVLRHPIQRAYSHYLMTARRGLEELPFDQAIMIEKERLSNDANHLAIDHQTYISRSMYSEQIGKYLTLFPDGKFLFIKFDDLIDKVESDSLYKRICDFIGTKYDVNLVDRSASSNQASTPRLSLLRNIIYRKGERSLFRKIVGSIIHDDAKLKISMFIDKLNQRKMHKSEIKQLADYNLDRKIVTEILIDIDKTEHITGLSLQNWKESLVEYLTERGQTHNYEAKIPYY